MLYLRVLFLNGHLYFLLFEKLDKHTRGEKITRTFPFAHANSPNFPFTICLGILITVFIPSLDIILFVD